MSFRGLNDPREPGVRYEAFRRLPPGSAVDDVVEGLPYRGKDGYLFRDVEGVPWWVLFSGPDEETAGQGPVLGDLLACARLDEEGAMAVRVLASGVSRLEADRAFQSHPPGSFEEAAALAAALGAGGSDT